MGSYSWRVVALFVASVAAAPGLPLRGADAQVQEVVSAMQQGNFTVAEQKLRAELTSHPNEAETLSLLGVVLDAQKKFSEAGEFHRRAAVSAPRSAAILYNYANHLLATGDEKRARDLLLQAVAANPADPSSNLALGQLALNRKDGAEALIYLDRVKDAPNAGIMRLVALDLAGKRADADALFRQLTAQTQNDGKQSAQDGWALESAGQFAQAETFLTQALATDPVNVRILYGLGVAASQAGHNERAREVLEAANRQDPKNVDTLYGLALVDNALDQPEPAIRLLAEAGQLAPQRADVQKLLAITAKNMKSDADSLAAWERYLKLAPGDEEARRERAFEKARLALLDEALPELQWYTGRHPDDPVGFYELGMAQSVDDPATAIATLDHAIALKADFVAARIGRGILQYSQGNPAVALGDLEFAVKAIPPQAPERAPILDRLGQVYLALNRQVDAVPVLRKAAELAPNDSTTLLHLANALAEAGQTAESDTLMERFRQMRPGARAPKVSGVVDYLGMTPEQRHDLYRARLENTLHDHPDNASSQILYLKLLLSDKQMPLAADAAHKLAALKPGTAVLADAGHALLAAKQYSLARELLEKAAADSPSAVNTSVRVDMALSIFHLALSADSGHSGHAAADEGLRHLDLIPQAGRNGDYYVARAEMLDAAGELGEAIAAMEQALKVAPERLDSYWQAAALLSIDHRAADALQLLDSGAKVLPQEARIPAIRALVLELAGKTDDALSVLEDAQHRWPEVAAVWVAQGIILAAHAHPEAARKALETAAALGAQSPEMWYALADTSFLAGPSHLGAARTAIGHALEAAAGDPQTQELAARIAPATDRANDAPGGGKGTPGETPDPAKLFLTRAPLDW